MSTNIRFPNITGKTEAEQLIQVKSYLHQLVEQLNWALSTIESGKSTEVNTSGGKTGSSSAEPTDTTSFNELKALIIKSSTNVESYYERINSRLESLYVSQSDFGTYTEKASQDIQTNASAIERYFSNMQQILTDIETLEHSLIEANAHIKSGLLYYDDSGVPVYGLEVGQRTEIDGAEVFDKYARFTSGRLSFYDSNGTEVAYIGDYKLYITNVEVKGSLRQGGYKDIITADGGVVTKWVGTGG